MANSDAVTLRHLMPEEAPSDEAFNAVRSMLDDTLRHMGCTRFEHPEPYPAYASGPGWVVEASGWKDDDGSTDS